MFCCSMAAQARNMATEKQCKKFDVLVEIIVIYKVVCSEDSYQRNKEHRQDHQVHEDGFRC